MAQRICVHIGAPKSGTTYLQTILAGNKKRLRDAGVLLPNRKSGDFENVASWVRGAASPRVWDRMSRDIRAFDGTVLLTSEWFCMAEPDHVARFVDALGTDQVDVVYTARSFMSSVPAAWQQLLKSGHASSLEEFVASMDRHPEQEGRRRWGWNTLDPAVVLPHWRDAVPPSRIHLVTVPTPGADPTLLWNRFATACGFSPEGCQLDLAVPNQSISAEVARLLQLIGPQLREAVRADRDGWRVQKRWIRRYFSEQVLLPQGGHPIAVGDHELHLLRQRAEQTVAFLRESDYHVIGDPEELLQHRSKPGARAVADVSSAELLELASAVMPQLLGRLREESERAHAAEVALRASRAAAER
ncbi:MAG TPA: hypothetical protein VFJ12_03015 [Segeticoccus sp.]|nr:hypothetical protein [Segeticoccus sp.]